MNIGDFMTRDVDLVAPTTTLVEAARMMRDDDVGFLPVGQGDRLVGMITDRDIVLRAVAHQKDPASTSVSEAMSQAVLYVYEDQSLEEAAQNMAENGVRRLPVLDRQKRLVGVVSLGDIAIAGIGEVAGATLGRIAQSQP